MSWLRRLADGQRGAVDQLVGQLPRAGQLVSARVEQMRTFMAVGGVELVANNALTMFAAVLMPSAQAHVADCTGGQFHPECADCVMYAQLFAELAALDYIAATSADAERTQMVSSLHYPLPLVDPPIREDTELPPDDLDMPPTWCTRDDDGPAPT